MANSIFIADGPKDNWSATAPAITLNCMKGGTCTFFTITSDTTKIPSIAVSNGASCTARGSAALNNWGGTAVNMQMFDYTPPADGQFTFTANGMSGAGDGSQIVGIALNSGMVFDIATQFVNASTTTTSTTITTGADGAFLWSAVFGTGNPLIQSPGSGYTGFDVNDAILFEYAEYKLDAGAAGSKTVDYGTTGVAGKVAILVGSWVPDGKLVYGGAINASNSGDQSSSYRIVVTPIINSRGMVSVTFASDAGGLQADHCSIGVLAGSGTNPTTLDVPVELKFNGAHGFDIGSNVFLTSDPVRLSFSASDSLVVIMDWGTGNNNSLGTSGVGAFNFFNAGTPSGGVTWNLANPGSRAGGGTDADGFIRITTQDSFSAPTFVQPPVALSQRIKSPQYKPQGLPRIDWTHPLTKGLSFYCLTGSHGDGQEVDLVTGRYSSVWDATKWKRSTTPNGPAAQNTQANASGSKTAVVFPYPMTKTSNGAGTGDYAIACGVITHGVVPSAGADLFGQMNATQTAYTGTYWDDRSAGGTFAPNFYFFNATPAPNGVLSPPETFNVVAGVRSAGVGHCYVNGLQADSGGITDTSAVVANDGTDQTFIGIFTGASNGTATGTTSTQDQMFVAAWDRALSTDELRQLYLDPYCFLIPAETKLRGLLLGSASILNNIIVSPTPLSWRMKPRQFKPQGIPRIDWTHPLANTLFSYWWALGNGQFVDLVTGDTTRAGTSARTVPPVDTPTAYGPGNAITGGTQQACSRQSYTWSNPSAQYTVAAGFIPLGTASGLGGIFGLSDNGGNDPFFIYSEGSSTQVAVSFGNAAGPALSSYSAHFGEFYSVVGVATGTSSSLNYQNLEAPVSASNATTFSSGSLRYVFGDVSADSTVTNEISNAVCLYGAVWLRALSAEEARQLYLDPYCFLIPQETKLDGILSSPVIVSATVPFGWMRSGDDEFVPRLRLRAARARQLDHRPAWDPKVQAAIVVTDDFNRANGPIGSNYRYTANAGAPLWNVTSNQAKSADVGTNAFGAWWISNTFGNDQHSQFTMVATDAAGMGPSIRGTFTAGSNIPIGGYIGFFDGTNIAIVRNDAGVATVINSAVLASTGGDVVAIEAVGSLITLYKNGVAVLSATDATYPSGAAGFYSGSNAGTVDNFLAYPAFPTKPELLGWIRGNEYDLDFVRVTKSRRQAQLMDQRAAWDPQVLAAGVAISGIAFHRSMDYPLYSRKVGKTQGQLDQRPAIALTPATLPVPISGQAYSTRWSADPVGKKGRTDPPGVSLTPATLPVSIAGMAYDGEVDYPFYSRKGRTDPPAMAMIPAPVGSVSFQRPVDYPFYSRKSRTDPPAVSLTPDTLPVGIAGMAFQQQWDQPNYGRKSKTVEQPFFLQGTATPVGISGIGWFEPFDIPNYGKRSRTVEQPFFLQSAPVGISGMAWFEPWDIPNYGKKSRTDPAALTLTPDTLPVGIFGMSWFEPLDIPNYGKKDRTVPPAIALTPDTLPVPVSGVAFQQQWDLPNYSKKDKTIPQPWFELTTPILVPIAGMSWFEPWDLPDYTRKFKPDAPPALSLTPATLPVGVSGMSWFEPWDIPNYGKKSRTDPSAMTFAFSALPVGINGMAWFEPLDIPNYSRKSTTVPQPYFLLYNPVPIAGMSWLEPLDIPKYTRKFKPDYPPAIALTPATLPVGISGMAWQRGNEVAFRTKPTFSTPPIWAPKFLLTIPPSPTDPLRIVYALAENRVVFVTAENRTVTIAEEDRTVDASEESRTVNANEL